MMADLRQLTGHRHREMEEQRFREAYLAKRKVCIESEKTKKTNNALVLSTIFSDFPTLSVFPPPSPLVPTETKQISHIDIV